MALDLLQRTRNLLAAPFAGVEPKPWFTIQAAQKSATKTSVEILIYDVIHPFGVSAGDFANELNALEADEITVGINSPGGIVFDGIAIMNALKRHPAKIIARIDGVAASAASFIAMAGDEIQTSKYGEMMIHEAWGYVEGDAEEMRAMADLLIRHNSSIASVYADRAGGEVKDWLKVMKKETWFTADEMVAAGLADTIIEAPADSSAADEAEAMKNRFDLTIFNYAGRRAAPPPTLNIRTRKEAKMASVKEQLAEKYELDSSLDDDAFTAALDAKLAETPPAPAPAASTAEPSAEQIAAHVKKLGFAMVDADTLNELKAQSKAGSDAYEAMQAEQDTRMVEDAIRAGKVAPASRDKWLKNLKLDRETYAAALKEAEAVFPVQEIGHGLNPDPGVSTSASADLDWFDTAPSAPAGAQSEGE